MTAQRLLDAIRQHGLTVDDWLAADLKLWNQIRREAGIKCSPSVLLQCEVLTLETEVA